MTSGRVNESRSLFPCRLIGWSMNRCATKRPLVEFERLDAGAHRTVDDEDPIRRPGSQRSGPRLFIAAHTACAWLVNVGAAAAEAMGLTPRIRQVATVTLGPVHRVEVELGDTVLGKASALFGCDRCRDQLVHVRRIVEVGEQVVHPPRDDGAAPLGEARDVCEAGDRHDPRDDRCRDPGTPRGLEETQKDIGIEEELGDRPIGAGIEFGFETVEVGSGRRRLGMNLGVGAYPDLHIGGVVPST